MSDDESGRVSGSLSDPLLDEIQFNGVTIGDMWRVQTAIEDFFKSYAQRMAIDDVMTKYSIIDRTGTRSFYLYLGDRSLFSPEVVVGIQKEVLSKWPEWTIGLVGDGREGEVASISVHSVTTDSANIDDLALFMEQFADEAMRERERRYGPLERQKQYVGIQLQQGIAITEDRPFQVVAIGHPC